MGGVRSVGGDGGGEALVVAAAIAVAAASWSKVAVVSVEDSVEASVKAIAARLSLMHCSVVATAWRFRRSSSSYCIRSPSAQQSTSTAFGAEGCWG